MASVAVLILNYNGEHHLTRFLPSIIAHSPGCEVIIGDNNSTDNSFQLLATSFPTVKVITLKENYGYAGGYNNLIEQLDHDYIALVNSDIEATPGWIEPLVSMLEEDKSLAAAQPKILSYNQKHKFEYAGAAGGYLDQFGYPFCRGRIFTTIEDDLNQYDDIKNIFWASGACFIIRRRVFTEAGGFDADFFAHMEEIDLCWRLNNNGYTIKVNGNSKVFHLGGGTLDYANPRKTYLNFRNSWAMLLKNTPSNGRFRRLFIRYWLDLIAIAHYFFTLQFKNSFAVIKAHVYIGANIGKIQKKRKAMRLDKAPIKSINPAEFSVVWQYYFKKKKRYSDLIPD